MSWHHWYWWTLPAGLAGGFAWSFILMCVIPPRVPAGEFFRAWKALTLLPARLLTRIKKELS